MFKSSNPRVFVSLLIIGTLLISELSLNLIIRPAEANPEWLAGWGYRRKITVDKADANLTDFPLLIHLSASSGKGSKNVTSIFDEVGSNYNAIAFANSERLYFEVEKWDTTNKEAWIWVKANLSSVSNTVFYMYYDATKDGSSYHSAKDVWKNNFRAVWHLSETGTGTRLDSTSNGHNATPTNYDGDEKMIGKIDGADDFDGTNDFLNCGTANDLNFDYMNAFSVSVWMKRDTSNTHDFLVIKQLGSGTLRGYNLWIEQTSDRVLWDFFHDYAAGQEMTVASNSIITDTNWHYIVATHDGSSSASGMKIYIDGQAESVIIQNNNIVGTIKTSEPFCIASRLGAHPFDGSIDEIQVSNVTRSSAWIKACYATDRDQLITWGDEQLPTTNSVSQWSPGEATTETQWTVDFDYKVTYYDTPKNACLRIFNSTNNSIISTLWNKTALQNDTSTNYGSYTFSIEQDYKWDCIYFNNSGNSWKSDSNWTFTVDVPPGYKNVGQSATSILENGTIELYSQGYDGIGLQWAWLSTNETGEWINYTKSIPRDTDWNDNKYALNPVLSPETGGGWTTFCSIVEENSSCWWCYYTSAPPAGSPMSISRASSTDGGYTWVKDTANNPVLTPNSSNSWENTNLLCPCVWKEGSTWHMIYTGTGSVPNAGYANSTDGVHWQRYSGNPVLTPSSGWESRGNEVWGVMKVNSTYYAWYSPWASGAPPTPLRQCGVATSTNLLSWAKDSHNPIFSASSLDYGRYCVSPFKYKEYYYVLVPYGWQNATYKFELFRDSEPTFYPETRASLGWVIGLSSSGQWDSCFIDTPYVATDDISKVLNDGNMLVYYSGTGNPGMNPYSTGLIVLDAEQALKGMPPVYGSPQYMNGLTHSWRWSNFTWSNSSIEAGTTIQWRIYYNDTYGNVAATGVNAFTVTKEASIANLSVDPSLVEKGPGDVDTTFEVNIAIQNVNDLQGFDLNLTWSSSLLTLESADFNSALDSIWGIGSWYCAKNESGVGFFKLAAVSTATSFNSTGLTTMCHLVFSVEDPYSNFVRQTLIHFATHKLSDSQAGSIPHTVTDGTYKITGETPALQMNPTQKTCRKYGETFTIQFGFLDAFNVTDFKFEIVYNTTLLDYVNVNWNAWGIGTVNVNETTGKITGLTWGSAIGGNLTLITIEFKATYHRIWKDIPSWTNNQSGTIFLQWANLSYQDTPDLAYLRGGGQNQISVGPDFIHTFSPIRGDIDNDGDVDIMDLRTVAAFYDQESKTYNLTGDDTVDIFDLVIIGSNFGYIYNP